MHATLRKKLQHIKEVGQYRSLTQMDAVCGKFQKDDKIILNFSSNDYLDLANIEEAKQAGISAIVNNGIGAPSSRLMSGTLKEHKELEKSLAKLIDCEDALVFGSGFLGNIGVITSLVSRHDAIFSDKLCHASIIDGIRLSGANNYRFNHNDLAHLEKLLQAKCDPSKINLIITESVFSMDGDIAPLQEIIALGKKYHAIVMIDEAHAIGVFGKNGGGLCSDLEIRPDIVMGTLGKAIGSYGGFCGVSNELKEYFINTARSFIFSTALPPSIVCSAQATVEHIIANPGLGNELLKRAKYFCEELQKQNIPVGEATSSIVPIMIYDNFKATFLAQELKKHNIFVTAIRPPTVPANTARLRLSITLAHSYEDLKHTSKIIADTFHNFNGQS